MVFRLSPGWGPGSYGYGRSFFARIYDPFGLGPPVTTFQLNTPYDWLWRTGTIQLHRATSSNGSLSNTHFEIIREATVTPSGADGVYLGTYQLTLSPLSGIGVFVVRTCAPLRSQPLGLIFCVLLPSLSAKKVP